MKTNRPFQEMLLELEQIMDRYKEALEEIASASDQANPIKLREIAKKALREEVQDYGPPYSMANPSGEPTVVRE
mgnify:CR=1 FL=1